MKKDETPAMPEEQAADLAALQAAAAAVEPEPQAGNVTGQTAAALPDLAQELEGLALAFVGIAAPMLPSLKRIYTPEVTAQAAAVVAAVCNKHGWLAGGLMGEYAEEIAAAVVLLPLGLATYQGVRGDLAALKLKNAQAEEAKRVEAAAMPSPGAACENE